MSTYNGERFIHEQMDSIFVQKDISIHLLIRDDGSTDSTLTILYEYKHEYPDKIDIIEGNNIGWRKSFFNLAVEAHRKYDSYEFFAFADQDDIWLPNKLVTGIEKLKAMPDGPNLYCSNVTFYKEDIPLGNLRDKSIKPTYKSCLIRNYATGCTIVFNHQLLELVCREMPQIKIAHDYWFYMVACLCGTVTIDNNSYILYRIHDRNQVGFKSGFLEIWKRRLKSVSNLINHHEKEKTAKELLRIHGGSMGDDAKDSVLKLADYRSTIIKKISLLFDSGYSYNKFSNDFWLRLKIVLGCL